MLLILPISTRSRVLSFEKKKQQSVVFSLKGFHFHLWLINVFSYILHSLTVDGKELEKVARNCDGFSNWLIPTWFNDKRRRGEMRADDGLVCLSVVGCLARFRPKLSE